MNLKKFSTVERWFNHVFSSGIRSKSTETTYLHFLGRFCVFVSKNPNQLIDERRQHLEAKDEFTRHQHEELLTKFRNHLETEKGLSRGTVVTAHNTLKSFYLANYVPLVSKSPKSWKTRKKKVPTQEELAKMIKRIRKIRDQTIIICLAQSGVSLKDFRELITFGMLKKELEAGISPLHLPMERQKIKKRYDTFLGSESVEFLKEYIGNDWRASKWPVFSLSSRAIQYIVRKAGDRARLKPHVSPHCLRSFFSTRLKLSGCPETQVEYWMGHTIPYGGAYFVPPVEEQRELYKDYEHTLSVLE